MDERGTIEADGERWTVSFVRELPGSPDEVWSAMTEPDRLARWLAPSRLEPGVGGAVVHDFDDAPVTGVVQVWEPPQVLQYSWVFSDGAASVLRVELDRSDTGTQLTLVHRGLTDGFARGYGAGWHAYLDRLAAVVGGTQPPGWESRFEALLPDYVDAAG